MAKKMTTKVLCCLVVIAILMSTIPVSVFASSTGDNVKFRGVVTGTCPEGLIGGTYWYVNVDEWISGSLSCDEIFVGIVIVIVPTEMGFYDPDISEGDRVEVYGVVNPRDGGICTVGLNGLVYYIKKIGSQEETKPTHPSPKIVEVKFPPVCVKEDEYATISVTVENNGGHSSEGYISVSFPYDEYIPRSMVSGTGSEDNKLYQKGSEIWGKNGIIDRSGDPLVELQEKNWNAGESHTLTMNVKPNSGSDEIVFYVRAALKNDADESYERDPNSGYTDQQGWYVKKYSVDVCGAEEVKFIGKIVVEYPDTHYYSFDVKIDEILDDPTGNLEEGETVRVYGYRSGPFQVDDATVGAEIKVLGFYRAGEEGDLVNLESHEHYLKVSETGGLVTQLPILICRNYP